MTNIPFLTLLNHPRLSHPHLVDLRKNNTAFRNLSSANGSLIVVLPGPALPSHTPYPNPFFPLYTCERLDSPLSALATPTSFHSLLISFFHALHSLKQCSLVCLPLPHHKHVSDSTHPNLSVRKGANIACPLAS